MDPGPITRSGGGLTSVSLCPDQGGRAVADLGDGEQVAEGQTGARLLTVLIFGTFSFSTMRMGDVL